MKSFKKLSEQHREKGRFKPVQPHNVPNSAVVSPRPSSDSASVKLKEENIEEGMSASVRLQRALQRAKEQREREERAGAALLKPKPPVQDEPPFEGPYNPTSKPATVTDKSGAKHTPMSRVKHLAKQAMKRMKTEMLGKTGTTEDKAWK